MKKIFFLLVFPLLIVSCKSSSDTVKEKETQILFEEVPANCRGISTNNITQSEFEAGLIVSVKANGKVLIAPPAQLNANSKVEEGGLIREFMIDGENALTFDSQGGDTHFQVTQTASYQPGACPDYIDALITSKEGTTFTLRFILNEGRYVPEIDYENGNYIFQNGMYRTKDAQTGQELWIKNAQFSLGVIYLDERRFDERKVEKTKGFKPPKTN
jgi:hypothetical protein